MSASPLIDFHGLPAVQLKAPDGAEATVLLQGAQIVSWRTRDGNERLYLSERASFVPGQAVRGGVPIIFPQFDSLGPLPRHGFARGLSWSLAELRSGRHDTLAVLRLTDDEATRALWPHGFAAELTLSLGGPRLDIELEVENTGSDDFSFAAALHSYLALRELEEASLDGLQSVPYLDRLSGREAVAPTGSLVVDAEIDRIYWGAQGGEAARTLVLREPGRAMRIEQHQFPDTVVWNPWEAKAARLADLPPLGFRRFLCVEAAVIGEPVMLKPGESWWGRQTLEVLV